MHRLLPLGTAFVLVLTACGAGHEPAPRVTNAAAHARPSVKAIAAARRREAARDATRILHRFVTPKGAMRLPNRAAGYPRVLQGPGVALGGEMVDVHAFWRVSAPVGAVTRFVAAHRPAGFQVSVMPGFGKPQLRATVTFVHPRGLATRLLNVVIARLPGETVLRADAQALWIYPRSPAERVPSGVRAIVFGTPRFDRRITNRALIARIVRRFDALPVAPPHFNPPCPGSMGWVPVTLDFRGAGGALLAHVSVDAEEPGGGSSVCNPIEVTILGRQRAPLVGRTFIGHVQRLIGVRVSPPG